MIGEGRTAGRSVYLDWNATAPPHAEVIDAMREAATVAWGNPSSTHAEGRRARAVVEQAREAIAALSGADPRDVIFTGSATEANNLALRAATVLVTSRIEHPSVVRVAELLERDGRRVVWLPVGESGQVDVEDVRAAVDGLSPGFVVALMAANHETGALQPVIDVAALVDDRGGRLHVDAVQAAGKLDPATWRAGSSLALAAHKLRGPKGIGALVLRGAGLPTPVLVGGAQERGLRPGTVDPVGAAGFRVAVARALDAGPARYRSLAPLRDRLEHAILPFGQRNGPASPRLPHVTNASFDGWRGDELVAALDLAGVRASSGSACSAGTVEPSVVVNAMLGPARAASAVRFSLGEDTTEEDVEFAISTLSRVVTSRSSGGSRSA